MSSRMISRLVTTEYGNYEVYKYECTDCEKCLQDCELGYKIKEKLSANKV